MRSVLWCDNADPRMSAMRNRKSSKCKGNRVMLRANRGIVADESEVPALRVCHQEVAEYLNPGD